MDLKRYTEFLNAIGTAKVAHTDTSFMAHLVAVCRLLESKGSRDAVCLAGLFHSIYGTEKFQQFSLPVERRDEVRALIGTDAERIAYLNCAMDRDSFDAIVLESSPLEMLDRLTGERVELSPDDFDDLCRVQVYDWLEQVPRSKQWSYRRAAYHAMAEHLGPDCLEDFERVFSLAPADASV